MRGIFPAAALALAFLMFGSAAQARGHSDLSREFTSEGRYSGGASTFEGRTVYRSKKRKLNRSVKRTRVARTLATESRTFRQVASVGQLDSVSFGAPSRFIGGSLKCAVNVNAALAARGIRGTGSALAKSFLGWGHSCSCNTPGAVAVYGRGRRGGHTAIVADASGRIWNPSQRRGAWQLSHYKRRPIACRCA